MKLALAMIVRGAREEAAPLAKCLANVSPHVDGIFLTLTYPEGGGVSSDVEEVAKMYGAHTTLFQWCNDFSKARNHNFAQVPQDYDYILWCDADDNFRGLEHLKDVIEKNPTVDAFAFYYLYAFDEQKNPIVVHQKTQVVRNDGCVKWEGALHEDFSPTRQVSTFFVKDIERLHLSDATRFDGAKERNLTVARQQVKDLPNDPRSYWNLGNSLKAMNRNEEAIETFNTFLRLSQSDDEKYIARLRLAESLWALDRKPEAIETAQFAIGLKPSYPDAYHLLGSLYLESHQFQKSIESYLEGLRKKPPYYQIIVYNPRDYDYVPMMNLAKAFVMIERPDLALPMLKGCLKIYPKDEGLKKLVRQMTKKTKDFDEVTKQILKLEGITDKEKLKKALDAVPKKFQAHPSVLKIRNTNFIKTESSGKDLVFFCAFTEELWTPETAKTKGIGGSEEAVIWLSQLLADRGWNVTVYNKCGHVPKKYGKVTYKPFWMWNYRDKQDVTILWRHPRMADYEINSTKVILDLHDVIKPGELTEQRLKRIDKVFVKSKWQRDLFPNVPDEKFATVPNGIDATVFEANEPRNRKLLINTSSPDRSLSALLDCYEEVKKQVPDAELEWAYGWGVFDTVHGENPTVMEWKAKQLQRMEELGVKNLGRLSHGDIAKKYLEANIFAYPSEFGEIDCISLSKAMAAGAVPVTTDFAAMGGKRHGPGVFIHSDKTHENWDSPYQFDYAMSDPKMKEEWVKEVVSILRNGIQEEQREEMRRWARETYSWEKVADTWHLTISDSPSN